MRRRILAMAMAVTMISSLAACGSGSGGAESAAPAQETKAETTAAKAEEKKEAQTEAAAPQADGGEKSIEGLTIAFVPKLTGNAFFESANKGAQEYAKKWGITVNYTGSPNAAVADEVQVVNQAAASGADGICLSSVDATGLDDALKSAMDAGVTVGTWDSDVSTDARTIMVSQGTPEILGKMLVDMGADELTKRGKDISKDAIKYCWHYSNATVTDQNSWQVAGEKYIKETYPNWENVAPDNYYSEQDAEKAVSIGASVLQAHSDVDLIICNDSTALPGQAKAAQNAGLTKNDVSITGFASPQSMKEYAEADILEEWGLWDCGLQGAMGCYLTAYVAAGNEVHVGDKINIPEIGEVELLANDSISEGASTGDVNNGVVLLPERLVFTKENVNDYDF